MDNVYPNSELHDQIQFLALALANFESDLRQCESSFEFEILMLTLDRIRMALESLV